MIQLSEKESATMFSPMLHLAFGLVPMVLLTLAIAVRPVGGRR
jgi:hypothetical protein